MGGDAAEQRHFNARHLPFVGGGSEVTKLSGSEPYLHASKNEFRLLESQIAVVQKEKEAVPLD